MLKFSTVDLLNDKYGVLVSSNELGIDHKLILHCFSKPYVMKLVEELNAISKSERKKLFSVVRKAA